ncbi:endo-beta-1,4-glucanase [Mytilinidion resinicola]|uniref:cellulase n=1 Tax=Mytilinidion resinicola TaxID=574789 RepID=A0A6A6YNR2_9PEZI|nr:endo-beta-1,4-glucanase [Mytilinidion resinicola]KAF2810512.1 endo-beta-1,4-glucanase [Mytilinidion resinicola]
MHFFSILLAAGTASLALAAPITDKKKRVSKFQFFGVNESGPEFGNTNLPGALGKDYVWPTLSTIDTFVNQGFNTFRINIMMERIIPNSMTGSLDATYLADLKTTVEYITNKGAYALILPHNYGRYYDNIITDTSGFEAFWKTLAGAFSNNSKVIFDTNNEFHDMDQSLVVQLNQAAINGIRAAGATSQYITVEGNDWTGAWTWTTGQNGATMGALTDPNNKLIYQMHQYLDSDGSGTSATCVSSTIGKERLVAATQWLKSNGKKGIIGEFAGGANSQCETAVQGMLSYMQQNSDVWLGALWWAAGPWWGDYIFSIEPTSGTAYSAYMSTLTAAE